MNIEYVDRQNNLIKKPSISLGTTMGVKPAVRIDLKHDLVYCGYRKKRTILNKDEILCNCVWPGVTPLSDMARQKTKMEGETKQNDLSGCDFWSIRGHTTNVACFERNAQFLNDKDEKANRS